MHVGRSQSGRTIRSATEWLWEGRVPSGELTLVAGRGDAGKTTLTLDVAAQLSRGDLAGTMFGRKGKTIFLSDEASFERVITPRYAAAGGEPGGLYGVEYVEMTETGDTFTRPMMLAPFDIRLLAETIREERIDLLIIDPIDMLLGAVDSHRNNEVRACTARRSACNRGLRRTSGLRNGY